MLVCLCNISGSDTVERSQPRTEEWVMLKHAHKTAITLVYREEWKGHRKLFSPRYDVKGRWIQVKKQVMQKDIAGIAVDVQIKGTFMAQIYRANEGENHVFASKMIVST